MKRRIFLLALVLLFPSLGVTKDKDGNYAVRGQVGCPVFVEAYDRSREERDVVYVATGLWIAGFITAYNLMADNGKKDVTGGVEAETITKWMAKWCRENSDKNTADAVLALVVEMELKQFNEKLKGGSTQ